MVVAVPVQSLELTPGVLLASTISVGKTLKISWPNWGRAAAFA